MFICHQKVQSQTNFAHLNKDTEKIDSYLQEIQTEAAQINNWEQIGNNILGVNEYEFAGSSLGFSTDGNTLAIGAPNPVSQPLFPGFVRVFSLKNEQWVQVGSTIEGESTGDRFGYAVSLSSDASILAIGAPINFVGATKPGYVKVYQNIDGEWMQLGQTIQGVSLTEHFGYSLSLSSDGVVLAVGSSEVDTDKKSVVRMFRYSNGIWEPMGTELLGSNSGDGFGSSVDLDATGNRLVVGSPKSRINIDLSGQFQVFEFEHDTWSQIGESVTGDNEWDFFAQSVSINSNGNVIAAGAPNANLYRGSVKVFHLTDSNSWELLGNTIIGREEDDQSGSYISLNDIGDIIAIGAPVSSNFDVYDGRTNVYKFVNDQWEDLGESIYGLDNYEFCGGRVALNSAGTKLAISYWGAQFAMGRVSVFDYSSTVSIDERPSVKISVYPNPANDYLHVTSNSSEKIILELVDLTGTEIMRQSVINPKDDTTKVINIKDLPSGVYILRIQNTNSYIKFIKQ